MITKSAKLPMLEKINISKPELYHYLSGPSISLYSYMLGPGQFWGALHWWSPENKESAGSLAKWEQLWSENVQS